MVHHSPIPFQDQVADRVAAAAGDAGTSIRQLSADAGIPRATLDRRLSKHSPFNVQEIGRIAAALGRPVDELLVGSR